MRWIALIGLACLALAGTAVAAAGPADAAATSRLLGRRLLACVDTFAACPGWVGQCAVPGVATYCPCMCGSGGGGGSTPPTTTPPPSPPPVTPPPTTIPTPPPTTGCVDTYPACPGWVGQCAVPGVATYCPCMCRTGGSGGSTPPPVVMPPPSNPPVVTPPSGGALANSVNGVSYHIYDRAVYPSGQVVEQYHTGYGNVDNLYCTDVMRRQPLSYWQSRGWTATTFIASGQLRCGDCVRIRNRRNGQETVAFVVDQGGKPSTGGFDLDYERVFKPLDGDAVNFNRGNMDIDWQKVAC